MEDVLVSTRTEIFGNRNPEANLNSNEYSQVRSGNNPSTIALLNECGINFFHYLRSLNLSKESDILVLPSNHHFYYDVEELKSVRTLVNIKELNLIKNLDIFLDTLVSILPPNTNFIGCFLDKKSLKGERSKLRWQSRAFNRFLNFLDSRTDNIMSKDEVSILLGRNGFKILDMKEINGLTYFYCKPSIHQFNRNYYKKIG